MHSFNRLKGASIRGRQYTIAIKYSPGWADQGEGLTERILVTVHHSFRQTSTIPGHLVLAEMQFYALPRAGMIIVIIIIVVIILIGIPFSIKAGKRKGLTVRIKFLFHETFVSS